MQDILNKTFFHFFLGFVAILAASLLAVFSVGIYQSEISPNVPHVAETAPLTK